MQMVTLFSTQMKDGCFTFYIVALTVLHLDMWNLSDGDIFSACISKVAFMKAPGDESGMNKEFGWLPLAKGAPMSMFLRRV